MLVQNVACYCYDKGNSSLERFLSEKQITISQCVFYSEASPADHKTLNEIFSSIRTGEIKIVVVPRLSVLGFPIKNLTRFLILVSKYKARLISIDDDIDTLKEYSVVKIAKCLDICRHDISANRTIIGLSKTTKVIGRPRSKNYFKYIKAQRTNRFPRKNKKKHESQISLYN
ncbi:MAG: hypothetical protein ABIG64_09020 [Candidatus Omnitrophota bacterium]